SRSEASQDAISTYDSHRFFDPPADGQKPSAYSSVRSKKEIAMAKRTAKRRPARVLNVEDYQRDEPRTRNLQVLQGGYNPANDTSRDRRFVKNIRAKSKGQQQLMEAIDQHALVLALGPAGTGKTYIAIAKAVEALEAGKIGRIVLSRPAVEAGESLGFL